jgi:hypothetical protein
LAFAITQSCWPAEGFGRVARAHRRHRRTIVLGIPRSLDFAWNSVKPQRVFEPIVWTSCKGSRWSFSVGDEISGGPLTAEQIPCSGKELPSLVGG